MTIRRTACLDDREWELYLEAATAPRLTRAAPMVASPCYDCLKPFADEMRAVGRCDGAPGARLSATPQRDAWRAAAERVRLRRATA